ncbi:MAG: 2-phospho-L-lactate guanylyltransferase [Anaerolineaceae bacterium]
MSLWAIVPVKPLRRGKSRLAGVLSEEERTALNYSMLGHTLEILSAVPEIDQTLVVSRDPAALALAREYHARTVLEDGSPHLNTALKRATVVAQVYATRGVLVLPADIPLVNVQDLQKIISLAKKPPVMVIVPDRRKDGTNALLICPAGIVDYSFGPGSFQRHCERARKYGIHLEVCDLPSLALDLDLPEDLELLRQMEALPKNT